MVSGGSGETCYLPRIGSITEPSHFAMYIIFILISWLVSMLRSRKN